LRSLQIALPLLLALASPSVFADQVAFKNGDRLTGAIMKSDAKSLLMTTAIAGEVTVSWQEIQELHSDLPLHVVLADGKELVGRMATRGGKLEIATGAGNPVEVSKDCVVALRNDAEQLAYEKSQHRSLLHGWDGGLDAGFQLTRGNSKTRNFRFAFGAVRKVSRDELILYAESLYSIDDVAGASPHVTANVNRGGARFDHDFVSISRLFVFANTDFMSDGLQDLNLRSVVGGGIGYHLINRDNATLKLLGGVNFTRENYVEIQRNLAAGQVGEELTLKLGKSTALLQNLAFFPDLTDSGGNYRTNFSLSTVTKIAKWLGWQNNFSDTYVTNPPAGKKQNELVLTSGLRLAFAH
jgi:putative salt-induced outer membrane protein YdiY